LQQKKLPRRSQKLVLVDRARLAGPADRAVDDKSAAVQASRGRRQATPSLNPDQFKTAALSKPLGERRKKVRFNKSSVAFDNRVSVLFGILTKLPISMARRPRDDLMLNTALERRICVGLILASADSYPLAAG
jgi:hypothetical protein